MSVNNEILIIGPPNSGKTTFLAQLYGRLISKSGYLKLARAPQNIEGIKEAYKSLSRGEEPSATPSADNLEVQIPVKTEQEEFVLNYKDYGGEQVRDITQLMEYDKTWIQRVKDNDRWVLFIRPSEIYHHYDLSMKGFAPVSEGNAPPESRNSDQYHFIELIQALLHARGTAVKEKIETPRLLIALTCWDEDKKNASKTPTELLKEKMPLFSTFIESNWSKDKYAIMGVSAQQFPLDSAEAKDKYMDELPESFGYLVFDDLSEEKDLTRLIEKAMSL